MSTDISDPSILRSALAKLKEQEGRLEDLPEEEHAALTSALSPFILALAELLGGLESAAPGALSGIAWDQLIDMIRAEPADNDDDALLPLNTWQSVTDAEVDAYSIYHVARVLEKRRNFRGISPANLRAIADEIDPDGAQLRKDGKA